MCNPFSNIYSFRSLSLRINIGMATFLRYNIHLKLLLTCTGWPVRRWATERLSRNRTTGKLTRRGKKKPGRWKNLNWQILNQNLKYFNPLVSGPSRFETLNYEKKIEVLMLLNCPFKVKLIFFTVLILTTVHTKQIGSGWKYKGLRGH